MSAPRAPGGTARATGRAALVVALLALACAAAPPARGAQGLDSLTATVEGGDLLVGFSLPVRSLRAAGIEKALDVQGLSVECEVSVEVRKREGLVNRTVVKAIVRRALSYSRWYEEYVLSENAREIATSKSYYATLDGFRRFPRLKVADLGTLDPGQDYVVRLEISLVPRAPAMRHGVAAPTPADLGMPKEMLKLFKGKGTLLSIKVESVSFQTTEVPRWSLRAPPAMLLSVRQP